MNGLIAGAARDLADHQRLTAEGNQSGPEVGSAQTEAGTQSTAPLKWLMAKG
jgi:hypothetical protein